MNVSMAQASAAMNANMRYQEMIADNLASASIPGYRKQELSFSAIQAGLISTWDKTPSGSTTHGLVSKIISSTDFSPGELKYSGQTTDIALEGEGFFEIQLPDESLAYTRDGEFQLSPTGVLVTKQGYPVMSDSGPFQMDMRLPGALVVSPSGQLQQGDVVRGQLKIVTFNNPQLLQRTSAGFFLPGHPSLLATEAANYSVRQGFVESSNTTPVKEMSNMLTSMRAYEANQRVIQLHDERMARAINELGSTN